MAKYAVKTFKVGRPKNLEADLAEYLNRLASDGWSVVSMSPAGLKVKGAGFTSQRPDSYVIVLKRS